MENVKIAVIGIGNMGSAHATCIAKGEIKGLILTAVCDININKLNDFKNSYPNIKTFENYSTLLNSNIADAVIIAVPHPLHAKIAISAFEHGLHVLLEKPADIKVSIVKKLNCIAHNSNNTLAILLISTAKLSTNRVFAHYNIITIKNCKRLVTDKVLCTKYSVT